MKKHLLPKLGFLFLLLLILISNGIKAQTIYEDIQGLDLSPQQKAAFVESIHQKVYYLEHYISRISDKSIPIEERLEMVDSAVKLFSNESKIIQVSDARTGAINQYPIRKYFYRLANIDAAKVEIIFFEGTAIQKVIKGSDDFYYGTALMYQQTTVYRGAEGGEGIYKDHTIKLVNFKSKQEVAVVGDQKRAIMETLLENINIKETKSK